MQAILVGLPDPYKTHLKSLGFHHLDQASPITVDQSLYFLHAT